MRYNQYHKHTSVGVKLGSYNRIEIYITTRHYYYEDVIQFKISFKFKNIYIFHQSRQLSTV